jgi:hypothetical protein
MHHERCTIGHAHDMLGQAVAMGSQPVRLHVAPVSTAALLPYGKQMDMYCTILQQVGGAALLQPHVWRGQAVLDPPITHY